MIPKQWYEHAFVRAVMRAVRVAVAAGISAFVGYLVKDPNVPVWLTPLLVALDKYLRDKGVY